MNDKRAVVTLDTGYSGRKVWEKHFTRMTLEEAKGIPHGSRVFYEGEAGWLKVKVTSVQTWKRDLTKIRVKIQFGLYSRATLTEREVGLLLEEVEE